jgi:anti-anti-sigma factor
MEAFRIEVSERIGTVSLHGEFDLAGFEELDTALERAQASLGSDVVLDLRGVTFMDASGLRALLRAADRASRPIRLIGGPRIVRVLLDATGTRSRFEIVEAE